MVDNKEWMKRMYLSRDLKHKCLKEIVMPGSHDAGTSNINMCSPVESTGNEWWAPLAKIFKFVSVNYSKTQNITPYEQAKLGVRYFDLRVYAQKKNNRVKYRYTHKLLGSDFIESIYNLCSFAHAYKKEILILDIRFTKNFTQDDHDYLQTEIMKAVGDRLAHTDHFGPTTKLHKYIDNGKNIVVIYPDKGRNNSYGFWDNNRIKTVWANKTKTEECLDYIDNKLAKRKLSSNRINNVCACLTPNADYIKRNLFGSTMKMAKKINKRLVVDLNQNIWKGKANCISVDVVEHPGLIDSIINLN